MKSKTKYLFLFIIITAFTLIFSSLRNFQLSEFLHTSYSLPLDILQHAGYYFFLIMVVSLFFPGTHPAKTGACLFLLSVLLEISQLWIPGRHFAWHDIFSNFAGILTGFIVWIGIITLTKRIKYRRAGRKASREL